MDDSDKRLRPGTRPWEKHPKIRGNNVLGRDFPSRSLPLPGPPAPRPPWTEAGDVQPAAPTASDPVPPLAVSARPAPSRAA